MSVTKYYIVPQEVYERVHEEKTTLLQKVNKLSPQPRAKARKLLSFLSEKKNLTSLELALT